MGSTSIDGTRWPSSLTISQAVSTAPSTALISTGDI